MYATEFVFDGKVSSEFGLIIGGFDGEIQAGQGGEVEVVSSQAPNRDEFDYFTRKFGVITWTFTVVKHPCVAGDDFSFSADDERHINRWLKGKSGYRELMFVTDDEPICYFVYFNVAPQKINGKTMAFTLTATSNCGYGFTPEITRRFIIDNSKVENRVVEVLVNNDIDGYILPKVKIENCLGDFDLLNSTLDENGYDEFDSPTEAQAKRVSKSSFSNVGQTIIMDSKNDIIKGLVSPSDFNYDFFKLVNGTNLVTISSGSAEITIKYRENRMVIY